MDVNFVGLQEEEPFGSPPVTSTQVSNDGIGSVGLQNQPYRHKGKKRKKADADTSAFDPKVLPYYFLKILTSLYYYLRLKMVSFLKFEIADHRIPEALNSLVNVIELHSHGHSLFVTRLVLKKKICG